MKLSVIMPAYNEKNTIRDILTKVNNVKLNKEIIVIDDGSKDGTREILQEYKGKKGFKVIFHERNKGKGGAVKTGIQNSTGDIVIIQDADLEYEPQDYHKLIQPIVDGKAKVVYGSRFLNKEFKYKYSLNLFATKLLSIMSNILYNQNITDEPTCYKVFRSDIIKSIKINGNKFEWEPEVTAKIGKMKIKIFEVPISYSPRSIKEGKKIKWTDGVQAIWTLIKYRFIS